MDSCGYIMNLKMASATREHISKDKVPLESSNSEPITPERFGAPQLAHLVGNKAAE